MTPERCPHCDHKLVFETEICPNCRSEIAAPYPPAWMRSPADPNRVQNSSKDITSENAMRTPASPNGVESDPGVEKGIVPIPLPPNQEYFSSAQIVLLCVDKSLPFWVTPCKVAFHAELSLATWMAIIFLVLMQFAIFGLITISKEILGLFVVGIAIGLCYLFYRYIIGLRKLDDLAILQGNSLIVVEGLMFDRKREAFWCERAQRYDISSREKDHSLLNLFLTGGFSVRITETQVSINLQPSGRGWISGCHYLAELPRLTFRDFKNRLFSKEAGNSGSAPPPIPGRIKGRTNRNKYGTDK